MTTPTTFHKVSPPVYFASWSTAADPPPDDPGIGTEPEGPPVYPEEGGYMLLDTLMTRIDQGRCLLCGSWTHQAWVCNDFAR
jgi:hypothetical protein